MRHGVENNINTERKRSFLRKLVKKEIVLSLAFPAVAIVAIMCGDHHDPSVFIEQGADMHLTALLGIGSPPAVTPLARMAFPRDEIILASTHYSDARSLQLVFGNIQIEDTMKNGMGHGKFDEFAFGKDSFHLPIEGLPMPFAPEIIRHEKSPIEKIFAKTGHLFVPQNQSARLDHVNPGVI